MKEKPSAHDLVKKAYGSIAQQQVPCCGPKSSCCSRPTTSDNPVPESELGLSCGNPIAFSLLREGDTVLDLGAGAGKDVFLAAAKVGPTGRAIGVDMTPEMLALARRNAEAFRKITGLGNVEFKEGTIEALPFDAGSVDVIISNCVINLSPDKAKVFREAYRVLRPGGRLIVSDIVLNRPLPESIKSSENFYTACIAGALLRQDYIAAIRAAGFPSVEILADSAYSASSACDDPVTSAIAGQLAGAASSITLRAIKRCGCRCDGC